MPPLTLPLSNSGLVTLVDDDIFILLQNKKLRLSEKGYVMCTINRKNTYLHRLIMKAKTGDIIDHISRIKLDNQRINLRFTSKANNIRNSKLKSSNKSGNRWVYKTDSLINPWAASVVVDGNQTYLGSFASKELAASIAEIFFRAYYPNIFPEMR